MLHESMKLNTPTQYLPSRSLSLPITQERQMPVPIRRHSTGTPENCRSLSMSILGEPIPNTASSRNARSTLEPSQPPSDPEPCLQHQALRVINLKKLVQCSGFKRSRFSCISPNGRLFGFVSNAHFSIVSRCNFHCDSQCNGELLADRFLIPTSQPKDIYVNSVALSDKYLFIAMGTYLLVRNALDGKVVGRRGMDGGVLIDNLILSPDGNVLLVLARKDLHLAFIYPANMDPTEFEATFVPAECQWMSKRVHSHAAFSANGDMVAVYTSPCQRGLSEIRFLKRVGGEWFWTKDPLLILAKAGTGEQQLGGKGVTGAAMLQCH